MGMCMNIAIYMDFGKLTCNENYMCFRYNKVIECL